MVRAGPGARGGRGGLRQFRGDTSMSSIAAVLKSSVTQDSRTPEWLLRRLCETHFGGRVPHDPCPPEPVADGLLTTWAPETFVNPPFNQLPAWLAKAAQEGAGGKHVVVLLPARVSTLYFHKVLLPAATSITVWCLPVAFPPHKTPFSLPVLTAEFGACNAGNSNLKRVPYRQWWQPGLTLAAVEADVARRYPGAAFHALFDDVAGSCRRVAAAGRHAVLLMPPWFSSAYFRALVPAVDEVVLIGPRPRWQEGGSTSLLGSVLVRVYGSPVAWDGSRDGLVLTLDAPP